MTVAELIERLRSYPQDAEVIILNDGIYLNGYYEATDVEDINETVAIGSNYDVMVFDEFGDEVEEDDDE